jgi:UDP-N-acetylglucosamine---dolichyl-phosphate N-acetylglucosaminyltransferase
MSGSSGEIVALIPAYNEVAYITDVVAGVLKHVPAVVVDDGSTDKTGAAAALAGAKVLVHQVNQGKGKALNTGFDYAVERGVAAAITIDADGQHDPEEIPRFIAAYRAGMGDLIIGQRDFSQMPTKNQFGNRTGTWLLGMAMGQPIPDNQSGYRLHSREVMRTVRPTTSRFEAEVEILLRAQMAGFRIAWVPIKTIYNDKVSHFRPIRDSALFLRMVWRIGRARRTGRFD